MIGTFLRLLKNKISDGGIIVHGVFDEFLDALKSKEKRFTAAVECFETLCAMSSSLLLISGSYSMLNNSNIKQILDGTGCIDYHIAKNIIPEVKKIIHRHRRMKTKLLQNQAEGIINRYSKHLITHEGAEVRDLEENIIPNCSEFVQLVDAIAALITIKYLQIKK